MLANVVRATDGMITWEMALQSFGELFLYVLWPVLYAVILIWLFYQFMETNEIKKRAIIGMIAWGVYTIGSVLFMNFIWKNYLDDMMIIEAMPIVISALVIWNFVSIGSVLLFMYIGKSMKKLK